VNTVLDEQPPVSGDDNADVGEATGLDGLCEVTAGDCVTAGETLVAQAPTRTATSALANTDRIPRDN
jgi:hypothetical protein